MSLTNNSSGAAFSIEQIRVSVEELKQESERRTWRQFKRSLAMALGGGTCILATAILLENVGFGNIILWLFGIMTGPCFIYVMWPSKRERLASKRIDESGLSDCNDIAAIPVLLDAMCFHFVGPRQNTMKALARLLPQMEKSQSTLIRNEHRQHMRQVLHNCAGRALGIFWPADYAIGILKAVGTLEDTSFLKLAQRLSDIPGEDVKTVQIRAAAEECREILQMVMSQEDQQGHLLRVADSQEPDLLLLRSAEDTPSASTTLLMPDLESPGVTVAGGEPETLELNARK